MAEKQVKLAGSALLVVDWQKLFTDPSSRAFVKGCPKASPNIEKAARLFLKAGRPVFASRHYGADRKTDPFFRFYGRTIRRNDPLFGLAAPLAGLSPVNVFDKKSYSLFENRSFLKELKTCGVHKLYLAGMLTDKCVMANAFAAFDKGFEVVVIEDCVLSRDARRHRAALSIIERSCGKLTDSSLLAGEAK